MFFTKRKKIVLFSTLALFGIFAFLQIAQACPGTGIFDYSAAVLDALDFIDMAVLKFLVTIMIFAIISSCYVILAAFLLQWSSQLPLYLDAPVVQGGWYFILGLTNLFIVLSLVFIALAYILKIESLELKKTLPKLIIVIVLVNFSMLITGIFVDVAQFFMNTFQAAFGADFIELALMPLRNSVGKLTTIFTTTIMGFVASAFIPFGSIVTLVIILSSFLAGDLLGSIFTTGVLIFLNMSLGTTFFIYFILFIVRIAYLWLLTIFSPLAFLAFVFKQTRGYGEKWFKSVFQWASLGVIMFFLLGLIVSLFTEAFLERPGEIEIKGAPGVPVLNLPNEVYNYLFLLIFLQIAYRVSMAMAPAGAQHFANIVKGQLAAVGGVAGIAAIAKKRLSGATRRIGGEKFRKKMEQWSSTPTRDEKGKFIHPLSRRGLVSPYMKRRIGGEALKITQDADRQVYNQLQKKASDQDSITNLREYRRTHDPTKQAAYLSAMIKKGQLKDVMDEKIVGKGNTLRADPRAIGTAYRKLLTLHQEDEQKSLERIFVKDHGENFKTIAKAQGAYTDEDEEKDRVKGYMNYSEKIIGEVKTADQIKQLQKGWWDKPELIDSAHKFWSGHQISEAARTFGKEFQDVFQESTKDLDWYYHVDENTGNIRNPSVPRYLASSGAAALGMGPIEDSDMTEINRRSIEAQTASRNLKKELLRLRSMAQAPETFAERPPSPPRGRPRTEPKSPNQEESSSPRGRPR